MTHDAKVALTIKLTDSHERRRGPRTSNDAKHGADGCSVERFVRHLISTRLAAQGHEKRKLLASKAFLIVRGGNNVALERGLDCT
jgi:hypothetical protein